MNQCRICHVEGKLESLEVREMMFGTRQPFGYDFCKNCGSLQCREILVDLSPHYPANYYAHSLPEVTWRERLRRPLVTLFNALVLFTPEFAFRLLSSVPIIGFWVETHPLRALRNVKLNKASRIVDVGGGSGLMVRRLRALGFRNLTCVDPYLQFSVERDGVRFIKATLGELTEKFDVVMYHHALEHVVDLDIELQAAQRSLALGGVLVVRMPTLPNSAYDTYGCHWIQIDAPRHIHIPSRQGLKLAAARCRLEVVATGDDSTEFQFWGSEAYAADLPLNESRHRVSWRERRRFTSLARAANARGRGDQAWFILHSMDMAS